ncbi:MAG TPA: DNA mismatch repair protein MutS [Thermoanaerobaculia bacterium]|nr:DNA mismatch repair protein MutS [Thermoanaerobaculia bacterium]
MSRPAPHPAIHEPAAAADPATVLLARRQRFAAAAAVEARRSLRLSWARFVSGGTAVAGLFGVLATAGGDPRPWAWMAGGAAAVFAALVLLHERVVRAERRWQQLVTIQEEALARRERRWRDLPVPAAAAPPEHRDLARDLQLFGPASLLQLLGSAQSPPGRATLSRWLVEPASAADVAGRQQAVVALAPALELRQSLELAGRELAALDPDVEPFLAWAEGEPRLAQRPVLLWTARLLPLAAWSTAAAAFAGILPAAVPLALFTATFAVANLVAPWLEEGHDRVAAREREMAAYAAALGVLWSPPAAAVEAPVLAPLRTELSAAGVPAPRRLGVLQRRLDLADARRSGLLRLLLGTLLLWDVHTLSMLERWQAHSGRHVRRWLQVLGELEALAALAGLSFLEPEWCFPRLEPQADRLRAEALAHPLLPPDQRVANDVTVGPAGTFLLVTGSNMSGKSTLLRAIGVDVVLAQAGGPVCARSLRLPPLRPATSILVEDSLAEGVSFFMAEVLRVRQVVEAAEAAEHEGRRLLYLLDEVLRGTNSADRRVAVREVVARLLRRGALGAISTHDLGLAEEQALRQAAVAVHFRETLHPGAGPGEPAMTFDYRLRPGLAPTANALRLLEMFGLR